MKKGIALAACCILYSSLFAQYPVTNGQWQYTQFPNGIIKLQWAYAGMPKAEAVGDAVIMAANTAPKVAIPDTNSTVYIADGICQVKFGGQNALQLFAYDSGHTRGVRMRIDKESPWFGGGERTLPLNRRGQRIPLYNAPHYGYSLGADELNFSIPFLIGSTGYGILFDNPAKGFFDIGQKAPDILEAGFESGAINLYLIPGNTPAEIIGNYALLTGKQPLPPRWALGNFMSRFGYTSQQQVQGLVAKMKKEGFAIDGVILDIFWFGDSIQGTLGNLDWVNKTKWPSPNTMIDGFRRQNINTILVTEPFFLQNTKNFEASLPYLATNDSSKPFMLNDFYFGYGGLIDLFRADSRHWFWQFYKKYTDDGIAGWWGDLGEPEKHPEAMKHDLSDWGIKRKMGANEIHNMYGHQWSKMLYENWTNTYPTKRLFFLNRAGYAGSQRYSIFPWTGDVSRSWQGLQAQLPNLQSMSLSGIPYIHSDAGGFTMTDVDDPELYIRWLQMAGFTPIFRPHGTALGDIAPNTKDIASEPVLKPEPYKSIARTIIDLRYQLLPYIYNLAWQQTTTGSPLIRPMIYHGTSDTMLLHATDQYLFGDAFLVAPVLSAGATQRKMYLPQGDWYRLNNNTMSPGCQWLNESVSIDHIPVFVKAGSFVPHWDTTNYQNTGRYQQTQTLKMRYYPSNSASNYTFYDDDGKNPQALTEPNNHQLLRFQAMPSANGLTLQVSALNWPRGLRRKIWLEVPTTADGKQVIGLSQLPTKWCINDKPTKPLAVKTLWQNTRWISLEIMFSGEPVIVTAQ